MKLSQLTYFEAVCACRSLSEAARMLYVSQPALSAAIRELEEEFGVQLFRRHHRGMELTGEGELLQRLSRELLNHARQVRETMTALGSGQKTLRLGIPPMIGSLLLPEIYGSFLKAHPDIRLEITEGGSRNLQSQLREGQLDMVLLPHRKPFEGGVEAREVMGLETVCCVDKDNPLARLPFVTPEDLAETPLVLFKNSFFQTEQIKAWFASRGVTPNVLLQTEQLSTLQSLLIRHNAVGFLFRQLLQSEDSLQPISLDKKMQVQVSLVWRREGALTGAMAAFLIFLENTGFPNG